jgi:hypothetical protein
VHTNPEATMIAAASIEDLSAGRATGYYRLAV